MMIKKIYLSPKHMHLGIINSQLINIIRYTGNEESTLLLLHGEASEYESKLILCHADKFEVRYYKKFRDIKKILINADKIYLRHITLCLEILLLKIFYNRQLKIIYDFRSLLYKESWYRNKKVFNAIILYVIEFIMYLFSDKLCAVSNRLKLELRNSFFIKRNTSVFPCATQNTYFKERQIDLKNTLKFVYSGSMNSWQRFDEVLRVYKEFASKYKCELSVFTHDLETANKMLKEEEVIAIEVSSLRQDELLLKLREFDFGFLVRENHFINNVASPIKFLEYISNGVIPIMSNYIGDFSEDVRKYKIGVILNDNNKVNFDCFIDIVTDQNLLLNLYEYSKINNWSNVVLNHPMK